MQPPPLSPKKAAKNGALARRENTFSLPGNCETSWTNVNKRAEPPRNRKEYFHFDTHLVGSQRGFAEGFSFFFFFFVWISFRAPSSTRSKVSWCTVVSGKTDFLFFFCGLPNFLPLSKRNRLSTRVAVGKIVVFCKRWLDEILRQHCGKCRITSWLWGYAGWFELFEKNSTIYFEENLYAEINNRYIMLVKSLSKTTTASSSS